MASHASSGEARPLSTPAVGGPIAIVGMSCLFPKAQSLREYWGMISRGVDAIGEVPETHWKSSDYFDSDPKKADHTYSKRGGFLSPVDFDPGEYGMAPANLEATDASQLLGLVVADGALRDAGYGPGRDFDRSKVSVILGVTGTLQLAVAMGGRLGHPIWRKALLEAGIAPEIADQVVKNIGDAQAVWQENTFPGLLGNVVAGRIANRFNLGGTNCVVDAACASSISAAHLAMLELEAGRSNMVVTGGVDTFNDIFMYMCFSKTPALSPTGNSKPFDASADGTILGEGLGMVVLKRLADAERDGDRIYAVIKGIGSSSDGRGKAIYAPSAEGQERCLTAAYAMAGVTPDTIELVEAHGTGTKVGDATEVAALKKVYGGTGRKGVWCALGSVKSQIGHTKAAAGIAGLIKASLALWHKVIPPTIKVAQPNPEVGESGPFYVSAEKRPWAARKDHPRRAGVSAFGFGGSNFHAVLEEHRPEKAGIEWDGRVQIVAVSSDDAADFNRRLGEWTEPMAWGEVKRRATESRRNFSSLHQHRLVIVADQEKTDLVAVVRSAIERIGREPAKTYWSTPDGAYFGRSRKPGKLAFLFPGQGSQYVGMARDLVCMFPKMQEILLEADLSYGDMADLAMQMSDFVFPHAAFSEEAKKLNEIALRATHIAQPAIGAVSLGMVCVLSTFGVYPAMAAGHSFGELMALFTGGRIDAQAANQLARLRGQLMAEGSKEPSSMIAVQATVEEIEPILAEAKLGLVIANRNAPKQIVLSGSVEEVEKASAVLTARRISNTRLPVAAAFHSPYVASAAEPFRRALDGVELRPGTIPIYSNTTAGLYPDDADAARDLIGNQLARPVLWSDEIEAMYADGARTFIEVGPGARMTSLVKAILGDREHCAVAVDASSGRADGVMDFARALAQLAALGHEIDLAAWEPTEEFPAETTKKPRMTVKLTGANYRNPAPAAKVAVAPQGANSHDSNGKNGSHSTPSAPASPVAAQIPRPVAPAQSSASTMQSQTREAQSPPPKITQPINQGTMSASHLNPTSPSFFPSAASTPKTTEHPGNVIPSIAAPGLAAEAFRAVQENLLALQRLQEQTSQLHQQFLTGQMAALQSFQQLAMRQQDLYGSLTGGAAHTLAPIHTQPVTPTPFAIRPAPTAPPPVPQFAVTPPVAPVPAPPEPPVAVATPPPEAQAPQTSASASRLSSVLLSVVSEKTGYPVEMIQPEMDLESDLGIDSIKRVEILSALQEQLPELPAITPDQAGKLRTLAQIVDFLTPPSTPNSSPTHTPTQTAGRSTSPIPVSSTYSTADTARISSVLLSIVSEKTGYPAEMIQSDMDLESDLGIDSIKRVEILSSLQEQMPELPALSPDQAGKLRTLAQIVSFLSAQNPAPAPSPTHNPAQAGAVSSSDRNQIAAVLLEIVSEKTGYPPEMIQPTMDLESDLGIDSIKRVEILSAVQERMPHLPHLQPDEAGKLRTLEQVVARLANGSGVEVKPVPSVAPKVESPMAAPIEALRRVVLQVEPLDEINGHHKAALKAGARVWITPTRDGLSARLVEAMKTHAIEAREIAIEDAIRETAKGGPDGLVVVSESETSGGVWTEAQEAWIKRVFALVQAAAPGIKSAAARGTGLLAGVARMDGAFGLASLSNVSSAMGGALAGLVKSAAHEWPELHAKAIDLDPAWSDLNAAAGAVAKELMICGPLEAGVSKSGRICIAEVEQTVDSPTRSADLIKSGEVVIVTGGARGVTAEVSIALADAFKPTLVLVGRSPAPEAEPAWLVQLETESDIKRAIAANMNDRGANPKAIEQEFRRWSANREVLRTLARIESTGARAVYHSLDVRDDGAVSRLVNEIRAAHGRISGLVHGAGVLADRLIEDKTAEQFASVFDTKIGGLRHLLNALAEDDLKFIALFSSVSGRYGRKGQADYAMANEALNKIARAESARRNACRVVAVNWGPWDGGMVTGGLKKVFDVEGVGLIPLRAGAEYLVRELASTSREAEVVVTAAGGSAPAPASSSRPKETMTTAFERIIDVPSHEFLRSHVINGNAVLPMVMMLEWLAHGALHANPGLVFQGAEGLRVLKGVILEGNEARRLRVAVGKPRREEGLFRVAAELLGSSPRESASGETLHARAEIVLAPRVAAKPDIKRLDVNGKHAPIATSELYGDILFHGAFLHGIERVRHFSPEGFVADVRTAEPPEGWMKEPLRSGWITDPLALDCALQLAVAWTARWLNAPSLPMNIGAYRQFVRRFPESGVAVTGQVRETRGMVRLDLQVRSAEGELVALIEGLEHVPDPALREAFRRRTLGGALAG